jgi:hypothetical protein
MAMLRWLGEEFRIHALGWEKDRLQKRFCALIDSLYQRDDQDLAPQLEAIRHRIVACARNAEAILAARYDRRVQLSENAGSLMQLDRLSADSTIG